MKVLVTGANGYVGRAARQALADAGHEVVSAVRSLDRLTPDRRAGAVAVGPVDATTDWRAALDGVEAVLHTVAPQFSDQDEAAQRDDANRVIVAGTERLLEQSIAVGVGRFVYLSSLKAMGEESGARPLTESDIPAPRGVYAEAKLAAERRVLAVAPGAVVIRSPAVYGQSSSGNVRQMIEFLRRPPAVLPLGYSGNRRSFIHRANLVSALVRCVEAPEAAGRTFLVSDGDALSTDALVRRMLRALGRRAWVVPVPGAFLSALAGARMGSESARRLVQSYAVDDQAIRSSLGWQPPLDGDQAMADAVLAGPDPCL
ncbi:NAD-dependent epimerase/dehydratase [alpha proteobacterium BAL199]|jgi:nucleoside-diphosphate-sugar epimerase|nr:NAD-dependent epimerase/dehydratase [alpha proteobacterium BAL199]